MVKKREGAWSHPLTSILCRRYEQVELYILYILPEKLGLVSVFKHSIRTTNYKPAQLLNKCQELNNLRILANINVLF